MKRTYLIIVACQVCAAVLAVCALRWLATYVDPITYGRYALYQSVVAAGSLFLINWPNAAVLRFGREEWTRDRRIGTTLAARMILFVVFGAVALAIGWCADPWLRGLLNVGRSPFPWIAAGLIVTAASELAIYIGQTVGKPQAYGVSPLVIRGGFLIGVILIPFVGHGVGWTYLAAWMIGATGAAAFANSVVLPSAFYAGFRFRYPVLVSVLRYSWALPFAAMTTYVVAWVDAWVIRAQLGMASVGVYNWAYQTTAIATLAFAPIAVMLTPRVIDARINTDRARIDDYVRSILPVVMLASAVVAVGMTLVSRLLTIVASPAYAAAYPVILILLAALPFQLLGYLVTPLGNAYENLLPRFVLVSAIVAVLNTLGDLALVPLIGISGAAVSTATAFAIGGVLQVVVVRPCGDFPPLWSYLSPTAVLVPSVIAFGYSGSSAGLFVAVTSIIVVSGYFYRSSAKTIGASTDAKLAWLARLPQALALSAGTGSTGEP